MNEIVKLKKIYELNIKFTLSVKRELHVSIFYQSDLVF
jgi:hypothetical protein